MGEFGHARYTRNVVAIFRYINRCNNGKEKTKEKEKAPIDKVRKPIPKSDYSIDSKKDYKRKNKYPRNWEDES